MAGVAIVDREQHRSPIFIIGTERSGSNALRILLNAHPNIASPHPPHLLRYLAPIEAAYGDLSIERGLSRLIDDAIWITRWHINPWDSVPSREDVRNLLRSRDVLGVNDAIYQWYARLNRKVRWACKSTFSLYYLRALDAYYYPDARFIWLVRDPRDVVASSKSSVFNPSSALKVAQLWSEQQSIVRRELDGREDKIFMLRYEDLAEAPETAAKRICEFIGEPFLPQMLDAFSGHEARKSAKLSNSWANVTRPISNFSVGSHRARLTDSETVCVEALTGRLMAVCGYATNECTSEFRLSLWRIALSEFEAFITRLKIEVRSAIYDENFLLRWRRDMLTIYLKVVRR